MPELIAPDVRYFKSFGACLDEFVALGPLSDWAAHLDIPALQTPAGFAAYVENLHGRRTLGTGTADPEGPVPESTFWWVEGEEFIGRIAVRHRLNEKLERFGGHIGYAVRPGAWGKGHARAMLRAVIPFAYAVGVDDALLTTDADNLASQKVIERCGGRVIREADERVYYRIRTHAAG